MRRSVATAVAFAVLVVLAACSTDRADQRVLVPTEPSLAAADQCSGSLASTIAKQIKDNFTDAAYTDLDNRFKTLKSQCSPSTPPLALMMEYIGAVIGYRGTINQPRAEALVNHWASLTLYITGTAGSWPYTVLMPNGGAAVLSPGEFMTTFDNRARLEIPLGSTPGGDHLYTFAPMPGACQAATSMRVIGNCYNLSDYPHEASYTPPSILTLCMRGAFGPTGILHEKAGYGAELLPPVTLAFSCADIHTAMNSWLGREAGPFGRVVAKAYDFLRPQPLFADDAGVSGSLGGYSIVGGALSVLFEDGFTANPLGALPNGTDPVVGDFPSSWLVDVTHPGSITIQNGLGSLTGNVVVVSQGQGACTQCPTVSLLGTRVNPSASDTVGSFEITWSSLQDKPSVKSAPFKVLSYSGAELASLAYSTESSVNLLRYNGAVVQYNGTPVNWVRDVHQDFKITLNLNTTNGLNEFTTSLAIKINGVYQTVVSNAPFVTPANTFATIGYVLSGIDAGIIAADNFLVKRLSDPTSP